jgi:hypothetical protein
VSVVVDIPKTVHGLAVIVHGLKGSKNQDHIICLAETSLKHGFITLKFDSTHSAGDSDGDIASATITSLIEDLEDVINWSKSQKWYEGPVVLIGHSMGAISVLEYAHSNKQAVQALGLVSACVSGTLTLDALKENRPGVLENWKLSGFKEEQVSSILGKTIKLPWSHIEDRLRYNSLEYAAELDMPTFMAGGSEDVTCPVKHQKLLFSMLPSTMNEFCVISGAPHTFRDSEHLELLSKSFGIWLHKLISHWAC